MCEKTPFASNPEPNPGRLMTFRGQRDLSLGLSAGKVLGKSRKSIAPNLNVQRNRSKSKETNDKSSNKSRNYSHDRKKERSAPCLVQETTGVFSEWSATSDSRRYTTSRQDERRTDSSASSRTKFVRTKTSKQEEERKVGVLCSDDFVVDPSLEPDPNMKPVQLPFHSADISLERLKPIVKNIAETVSNVHEPLGRKDHVKKEAEDKIHESAMDPEINEQTVGNFFKDDGFHMFMLQLPDVLPVSKFESTSDDSTRPSTSKQSTARTNERLSFKSCNLGSVPDGYLGKIQIRKSGKVQLVMNDMVMDLASSLQVGCREDVVAVNLDSGSRTGDMVNLGPVEGHIMCLPDWEQFLS